MQGISIVICCYNSESRIKETLEALQMQEVGNDIKWEVLLVDNNSTDKTIEVSEMIWKKDNVTNFRVVSEPQPGQAFARKKGIQESAYDIISFVDDDNRVCKNWVTLVAEIFSAHPECAACGGIGRAVFEKTEPFWFKKYQENFAIGPQGPKSGYVEEKRSYLYGAGFNLRKKSYELLIESNFPGIQTGRSSITHRGGGEDSELSFGLIILGFKLWYDERLKFDHYMPESRLNIERLIELQKGFGRDEVVLSLYRSYISNFYKPDRSVMNIYIKAYIKLMIFNFKNRNLKDPELLFYASIYNKATNAYLSELLYYRTKFKRIKTIIAEFVRRNKNRASEKQAF
ncbi:MAG: glycosyltransferase family 2 protein [Bacteroidetes bacterium]|nr:glycosyltransferase family 2 protein [Bacteroidota bacterium]MBK9413158.1 glycosyltransferase family 2 protein [Bacteroidota bacterium]MBP6427044.1 glycosyltransferase family 2 protein [Bacteroidia bacterium]